MFDKACNILFQGYEVGEKQEKKKQLPLSVVTCIQCGGFFSLAVG
jgi:hypothetical protein